MSTWTHVTGAIRFDGIPMISNHDMVVAELKSILGNTCKYDDSQPVWDECSVPCGSEGSIQYLIHEYDKGLPWIIVAIWGDLRDYENMEEISKWFGNVCLKWPLMRQAILEIECDKQTLILRYANNKLYTTYCITEKENVDT